MRYTLKVYPVGMGRKAYRVITISGKETLDTLCEFILNVFDFSHEHLYEFCMDNKMYSDNSYRYDPEGFDDAPSTNIKIDRIGLQKGQKFSLHYDYGDDWMFAITVQKIEEEGRKSPPTLEKSTGFVEQYPSYEDYEEEEDDDDDDDENEEEDYEDDEGL